MRYLHTMVRVSDLEASLRFWRDLLGLVETRRMESQQGRFTLVYLAAPQDRDRAETERSPELELTYNWDPETYTGGRNFGHMAFVRSPDGVSVELLQDGEALVPAEPWTSMPNIGAW